MVQAELGLGAGSVRLGFLLPLTRCHKAIVFSPPSCVTFSYLFARTVPIQKTRQKFTLKPREDGAEVPLSTDSLDVDRSKAKSNLTHLRQKKIIELNFL